MADGDRHGVASVFGFDASFERQQRMHHQLHLLLFGAAVAHHAGLDFERRVLADRESGFRHGEQHHAPGVRQFQRGLHVLSVEDLFHGRRFGRVRVNHFAQSLRDGEQANFQAAACGLV